MEQLLHYVWKHRLFPLRELETTDGKRVEVIDPGLHNRNAGTDFFNAKVNIGRTLWVGNVEIHDKASDWYLHHHDRDPRYNNVVLHVVGEVDTDVQNAPIILVAEDEDNNYELVRVVLSKRYRLLRAHNGIEAVTLCEDEHPDLILMDIRMPDMNGLDATRIIKEVNHDVPVIALSAYAFDENIREAKEAGCDEFLAKPFRVEELLDKIQKYLKK